MSVLRLLVPVVLVALGGLVGGLLAAAYGLVGFVVTVPVAFCLGLSRGSLQEIVDEYLS